jgi:hypothetical protein
MPELNCTSEWRIGKPLFFSKPVWHKVPGGQFHQGNKKPATGGFSFQPEDTSADYLFMTYIVTSKPKRISVAAGLVHMIISFWLLSAS